MEALNRGFALTWLGHNTFKLVTRAAKTVLLDPWVEGNPSCPKEQKTFVDKRVAGGGFGSVSDYVRELIRRDQRELAREEVERRLLAALESPSSEMTPGDWKELRENLIKRHGDGNRS